MTVEERVYGFSVGMLWTLQAFADRGLSDATAASVAREVLVRWWGDEESVLDHVHVDVVRLLEARPVLR